MTPLKPPTKRDYQKHGLYTITKTLQRMNDPESWLASLGEVGRGLKEWRAAILQDLGGESNVSSMELAIVEMAAKTHLMLASVDQFLLAQTSLINKSKRQLFPVVLQRQTLADALARYMGQLGLKRRATPTATLADYLAGKDTAASTRPPEEGHDGGVREDQPPAQS
jgi:hypothetical protein